MIVMRTDASIQIGSGHVQALPDLGGGTAGAGGGGAVHLPGSVGVPGRGTGRPGLSGTLVAGARCRWGRRLRPIPRTQPGWGVPWAVDTEQTRERNGEIMRIADMEGCVVVTKDEDFVRSFWLRNQPHRLLQIATGNNRPPLGQAG